MFYIPEVYKTDLARYKLGASFCNSRQSQMELRTHIDALAEGKKYILIVWRVHFLFFWCKNQLSVTPTLYHISLIMVKLQIDVVVDILLWTWHNGTNYYNDADDTFIKIYYSGSRHSGSLVLKSINMRFCCVHLLLLQFG